MFLLIVSQALLCVNSVLLSALPLADEIKIII